MSFLLFKVCAEFQVIMGASDKVLITGGYGFMGAHLAAAFTQSGQQVTLYDDSDWSKSAAFALGLREGEKVTISQGSVMDPTALGRLAEDYDYIIHAAGVLGLRKVAENPLLTMDVNVLGTRFVLDVARRQKRLKKFVQISTSEVYGQNATSLDENHPGIVPVNGRRWCYAASKIAGEHLAMAFFYEFSLPVVIICPFNVYGPYRFGTNALTTLISRALADETLVVSGDGKQTRSWCHINDYVRGVLAALSTSGVSGERFNIGNDKNNVSMLALAELIRETVGSKSKIEVDGLNIEDVQTRKPNIEKARQLLGYEPKVELADGIKDVAGWLRSLAAI